MSQPLLRTENLTVQFGGVVAVDQVSISVESGQIFGLIGPNGAGKTTLFNLVTGVYKPTYGKIFFKEKDLTPLEAHEIAAFGISRTFQNIRLLKDLTVKENILLAYHRRVNYCFLSSLLMLPKYRKDEQKAQQDAEELIQKYGLAHLRDEMASELPQGIQRKIEIVRALATGAELIFLDEPAAGLNPVETTELVELIKLLRNEGKTIVLIEHDMKLVKGVCDKIAVLHFGKLLDQGTYEKVTTNPEVIQAYLGRRFAHAQSK
jgi:branched-chain amino acid transport system ATP-binding protein